LLALSVFSLSIVHAHLSAAEQRTESNVGIFKRLAAEAAEEVTVNSHFRSGDSIHCRIAARPDSWIIESALLERLKSTGCTPFVGDSVAGLIGPYVLDVVYSQLDVRYEDSFREGIFGSKRTCRHLTVSVEYRSANARTGEILASGTLTKESRDTVAVDDLSSLEDPGVRSSHGVPPGDTFLDKIAEPFVILGAAGVVVYLFFHVRS